MDDSVGHILLEGFDKGFAIADIGDDQRNLFIVFLA